MRAIHMKMYYKICLDNADIFILHICPGYKKVATNLKKINVFTNVYELDTSVLGKHIVFKLIFGHNDLSTIIKKEKYNKLFTFNIENDVAQAIFSLNHRNKNFEHHCVEDTPSIYALYEPPKYKWYHPFKWLGIDQHAYHITNWWTSDPATIELPKGMQTIKQKLIPIDPLDKNYIRNVNIVFSYKNNKQLDNADILIMDESHYTDGLLVDDFDIDLYTKISKRYCDKNILVKLHPRTIHNRYSNNFQIMENTDMPWEIYILNRKHEKKDNLIQIGIICGTLLSDKFMFNIEGRKIMLAPLFYGKIKVSSGESRVNVNIIKKFEIVRRRYKKPENFVIAYSEENIYQALDEMLDKDRIL